MKKNKLSRILAVITALAVIGIDQYTKYFIDKNFELWGDPKRFINGIIEIQYIHNPGGAWGILSGYTWVLLVLTVIVMAVLIALLIKLGKNSRLLFWAVCFIISGGIGNIIDRVFRDGKVIDFLHFEFFPTFPTFNVADIAVCVGAGLLILYFIIDTVNDIKAKKQNGQN